ncbi:MAG: hypothetical protein RIS29_1220 [Bacteroidota bacterium]|jgi:hypothetical protein
MLIVLCSYEQIIEIQSENEWFDMLISAVEKMLITLVQKTCKTHIRTLIFAS